MRFSLRRRASILPVASVVALFACLLLCSSANAQTTVKTLEGKVFGSGDAALANAIVYLQDSKTNDIKSFITISDGSYRFGQISADTDYTVWAAFKGKKSPTKQISSFDPKKQIIIDLHIKTQ